MIDAQEGGMKFLTQKPELSMIYVSMAGKPETKTRATISLRVVFLYCSGDCHDIYFSEAST